MDPQKPDPFNQTPPPDTSTGQGQTLDPDNPEAWLKLKGYRLVREISRGGQAIIFEAIQKSTGRRVAVKLLNEGPWGSERAKSRMDREVKILAALDHPGIVSVIDRGETDEGWMYFVLNFVEGKVFSEYLDEYRKQHGHPHKPADFIPLLRLFVRICNAIHAAHVRGIVHRDIKPSNILIDAHGEPYVLDFGVARPGFSWTRDGEEGEPPTATGEFLGSLQWASPEQADGSTSSVDIRSDVYSLGVIFYELLADDFPYPVFGKVREVLNHIVNTEPKAPSQVVKEREAEEAREGGKKRRNSLALDPALDAIALKALAKNRDQRYQSAGDFARDIERYLQGQETVAHSRGSRGRRSPMAVVLPLAAVILGAAVLAGWYLRTHRVSQAPVAVAPAADMDYVVGYYVEGDEVVFEFQPHLYDTVRMADGSLGRLESVDAIRSVNVSGPFNRWTLSDPEWQLREAAPGRFSLPKRLSLFKDGYQWPFKFVVNHAVWVSGPELAANREVVVEDTATYNLLFLNPTARPSPAAARLFEFRKRINEAWPGQGVNLALDGEGQYHLTLARLPRTLRIRNLDPLRGIPLAALNISAVNLTDLEAIKGMTTLKRLVVSDATRAQLLNPVHQALAGEDRAAMDAAAGKLESEFAGVPAIRDFVALLRRGLKGLEELEAEPGRAPESAWSFQKHDYLWVPTPMSWSSAREFCESHRAHLVSITSEQEQEWVTGTFGAIGLGQALWLGGTDEQYEGHWGWLSGERMTFVNWTTPEPNNDQGNENALAMRPDGWWFDTHGEAQNLSFLMEWP